MSNLKTPLLKISKCATIALDAPHNTQQLSNNRMTIEAQQAQHDISTVNKLAQSQYN